MTEIKKIGLSARLPDMDYVLVEALGQRFAVRPSLQSAPKAVTFSEMRFDNEEEAVSAARRVAERVGLGTVLLRDGAVA